MFSIIFISFGNKVKATGFTNLVFLTSLREYFVSSNKNIRATIDSNINYINIQNFSSSHLNKFSKSLILEIKYSNQDDEMVRSNLENISFRISKNSKYVNSLIDHPHIII